MADELGPNPNGTAPFLDTRHSGRTLHTPPFDSTLAPRNLGNADYPLGQEDHFVPSNFEANVFHGTPPYIDNHNTGLQHVDMSGGALDWPFFNGIAAPMNGYDYFAGNNQMLMAPMTFLPFQEPVGQAHNMFQPVAPATGWVNDFSTWTSGPSVPANVAATDRDTHHRCPKGCSETFRRPGDYRRHMKKHDPPKFRCNFVECDKTFYRLDKLRNHLKQGHKLTL